MTKHADALLMSSQEPSASSASASASSPTLSVPSQQQQQHRHQDHHTQTHPTSCGPLLALHIRYEESNVRIPLHALPFPHPKWRVDAETGNVYEDASAILEACEPGLGDVLPSIESSGETGAKRTSAFREEDHERVRGEKERRE